MTETQPALPGLGLPEAHDGPMAKAAHASITELRTLGRIEGRNVVMAQMVLSLAAAIDRGVHAGRASAVALAAAQLREAMLVLDPPAEDATPDARNRLEEFLERIEQHANTEA